MKRALLLLSVLALVASPTRAQREEPSVTARLDDGLLKLGGRTSMLVVVENADRGLLLPPPPVDGLVFGEIGRPSLREEQSIVGNRVRRYVRLTWSFSVKPEREGRFTIPPLTVEVGGQALTTAPQSLTVVTDMLGADLGFLEIETSGKRVVEGQPFTVELRFGWDLGIASKINHADLSLPWWGQLPGTVELDPARQELGGRKVSVSLNGGPGTVEVEEQDPLTVHGREQRAFRVRRTFLAARSGALAFPTSSLEFSRVVDRGSFLRPDNQAVESYFVLFPAFEIDVRPLPEDGRPYDFTGAVGSISAWADADTRDVLAGESIKLTVEWSGAGNLEFFDLPDPARMDAFAGIRVYGSNTVGKGPDFRRAVYDLAPLSPEVTAIPPLPLQVFDPVAERYVEVATRAIPIRVRALAGATTLADEGGAVERKGDVADIDARPLSREARASTDGARTARERGLPLGLPAGAALGVTAGWIALRVLVRRRRGDPSAPLERRRRAARKRLARALAQARDPAAELAAVTAFLAARTREPDAAWSGRDVRAWLRGGEPELGPEEGAALEQLVSGLERATWARKNGGSAPLGSEAILGVADRLLRRGL